MRIDNDPKLDFDDVLIRPKRSGLESRSEVNLNRTLKMPHSKRTMQGIPLIAANMDTVGSICAAMALHDLNCYTALHKYIPDEEYHIQGLQRAFIPINMGDG